ncbi:MAG: hypothetical protein JST54_34985 [Deltaproteobacteria bacterium]|nr:hypothetical protein [Deltaproteobacteria bacterium]
MRTQGIVAIVIAASTLAACHIQQQLGASHQPPNLTATKRLSKQEAVARVETVRKRELVLVRPGKPMRILVADATPISLDGELGTLKDLQPRMLVRVNYDAMQGPARATLIEEIPEPGCEP